MIPPVFKKILPTLCGLAILLAACSAPPAAPASPTETQTTKNQVAPSPSASSTTASVPLPTPASSSEVQAPDCTSPAAPTPALTEGPYFKANSPERSSLLVAGMPGTMLTLTGYVLTTDCQSVTKALLDFWQADSNGQYDNNGYTLRGHQFTDNSGRYHLETIVPGLYPGRTEHIHVKVQAPGGPVLITQLFFPGVSQNERDSIFNPGLLLDVQNSADGLTATFTFIVEPH